MLAVRLLNDLTCMPPPPHPPPLPPTPPHPHPTPPTPTHTPPRASGDAQEPRKQPGVHVLGPLHTPRPLDELGLLGVQRCKAAPGAAGRERAPLCWRRDRRCFLCQTPLWLPVSSTTEFHCSVRPGARRHLRIRGASRAGSGTEGAPHTSFRSSSSRNIAYPHPNKTLWSGRETYNA
jgi:hypothetical protein